MIDVLSSDFIMQQDVTPLGDIIIYYIQIVFLALSVAIPIVGAVVACLLRYLTR